MRPHRSIAFAAVAAVWLLGLEGLGVEAAVAYLAPALLILMPLIGGRYPGDRAFASVVARRSPERRRRHMLTAPSRRRRPEVSLPRGGRLVGAALAGRAPPGAGWTGRTINSTLSGETTCERQRRWRCSRASSP